MRDRIGGFGIEIMMRWRSDQMEVLLLDWSVF